MFLTLSFPQTLSLEDELLPVSSHPQSLPSTIYKVPLNGPLQGCVFEWVAPLSRMIVPHPVLTMLLKALVRCQLPGESSSTLPSTHTVPVTLRPAEVTRAQVCLAPQTQGFLKVFPSAFESPQGLVKTIDSALHCVCSDSASLG